jgi:hypothetical protein
MLAGNRGTHSKGKRSRTDYELERGAYRCHCFANWTGSEEANSIIKWIENIPGRDAGDANAAVSLSNEEFQHKRLGSQPREEAEENLITLCAGCHSKIGRTTSCSNSIQASLFQFEAASRSSGFSARPPREILDRFCDLDVTAQAVGAPKRY